MKINKIDYKGGKHFILQDADLTEDPMDFIIGEMSKEDTLKPEFIKSHKDACIYYGIPAYYGVDKDLLKVFK